VGGVVGEAGVGVVGPERDLLLPVAAAEEKRGSADLLVG